MKDQIKALIGNKLDNLGIWIDDVYSDKEDGSIFLRIVLDSKKILTIEDVTMATRIINPLLDKEDLFEDSYILDVYAKEKGDDTNEQ